MSETQSITIASKLQVPSNLVPEINEIMLVFALACDWVNKNTPEKMTNKTAIQMCLFGDLGLLKTSTSA